MEKQKKKELRKADKGKGFDSMIAYVDENGFLTDTPPTAEKKEHIRIEDIEISVPPGKKTETAALKGRV
ncbi:MAG: cold shock domain-containing protein, partial [Bacteroidales bacterium]|nr:cold shock domain-containing protein [Bacteroidales bacterium]